VVDPAAVLTPRETEVLGLLAQGHTNRQIGAELYISEKTASVHVSNILAKLRAGGRTEAVAIAAQRGLLPIG
jgi:DNA-binding NarL/FixJ family response regulator